MTPRAVSLGGFALSGACQVCLGAVEYVRGGGLADAGLSVGVGLFAAWFFGRLLVDGNDLNGLADRPLFALFGALVGLGSAAFLAFTVVSP
ncbi:hypothetical protein [Halobaculum lipolyticum]|uniref:Uncharacterized protein n=1 Tax=Halobaculum lipolyticum TaxID=3032001 RepID=A0ABD5WCL8_9EURY|nr:hypothetical protein [Halobaculum sp. DT31]